MAASRQDPFVVRHGDRDDPLAPSQFDPANVTVVDFIDTQPPALLLPRSTNISVLHEAIQRMNLLRRAWEEKNIRYFGSSVPHHQCDHCGAHIRWAYVIKFIPTDQHFIVGQTCGEERMTLSNRAAFDARAAQAAARRLEEQAAILSARIQWSETYPLEAQWLIAFSFSGREGNAGFFGDLASQLERRGALSEKQTACITREITREAEREARRAEEVILLADASSVTEGRYAVTGEVVHRRVRLREWGLEDKILLKAADGNKFWVSTPKALAEEAPASLDSAENRDIVGMVVQIVASWTPSGDDPHFAFGKRPVLKD